MDAIARKPASPLILRSLNENITFNRIAIFEINTNGLARLIPELHKCKGVLQGLHHQFDVFDHLVLSAFHVSSLADICRLDIAIDAHPKFVKAGLKEFVTDEFRIKARICLRGLIDGVEKADLFIFACLIHDIGKPATRKPKPLEKNIMSYSFPGHTTEGAVLAEKICNRLRLTAGQTKYVVSIVKHHKDLAKITRSVSQRFEYANGLTFDPVREALERENIVVETVLLTIADTLAKGTKYPEDLLKDLMGTLKLFAR